MSKVWSEIVEMVETNFLYEPRDYIMWGSKDESTDLRQAINDLLTNHPDVVKHKVDAVDAFESPGYDTGVVYAAWVEQDGSLHTIDYQWESM
jgi:hypothetical protein